MEKSPSDQPGPEPKATPTSDRHQTETALHDVTDTHQTDEAEQASHAAAAKAGEKSGSGSGAGAAP